MNVLSFSEVGGHLTNEDAFRAEMHPAADCWLVFLADGQGGRAGGAEAAKIACESAHELAVRSSSARLSNAETWVGILQHADQRVASADKAGFTTLIGFCVMGDEIVGASGGDSAVLALHGQGNHQVLTSGQFKNPPTGSGEAVFVPFAARLRRPWVVLAMSDGVWKYVGWERIVQLAGKHQGEELVGELQQAARLRGSGRFQDDFTVVLLSEA